MDTKEADFDRLREMFKGDDRGLLAAPQSEEEKKRAMLNECRLSIIQVAEAVKALSAMASPSNETMKAALSEFPDKQEIRSMVYFDWLDRTYRGLGKLHQLEQVLLKTLEKELQAAEVLGPDEKLPEEPATALEPVLSHLAARIKAQTQPGM